MKLLSLLEFTVWMLVLYGYYRLLLAEANWFQVNRFFLLLLIPISWAITLIEIPFFSPVMRVPASLQWEVISIGGGTDSLQKSGAAWTWISVLYGIGVCAASLMSLFRLARIIRMIKTSRQPVFHDSYVLIPVTRDVSTASFFRYIFWNASVVKTAEQQRQILTHELCHVRQWHSLDLLIMEVCTIVLWFHPLVYLIRRDLVQTHEYLADREAVQQGDKAHYISLMLEHVMGPGISLSHSFFQSPINKRIMMLMKQSPQAFSAIRYLFLIPLCAALVALSSCQAQSDDASAVLDPDINASIEVDIAPKPLNLTALLTDMGYPKEAEKQGIEGVVVMRILLDEAGKYVKHEVLKGDHDLLIQAAEEKVSMLEFNPAMKDGKSVRFWVNIPFNFKLTD